MKRFGTFLITVALIAGIVGCGGDSGDGDEYVLTIASTNGGLVTSPGEGIFTYNEGAVVNLVAEPEGGYYFVNWTGDVATIDNVNAASTNIAMNSHYSITANFEQIPPGQFSLTIASTAGGTVTIPGEGTFLYNEGTVVSLTATPASGYQFVKWTGDVSTVANVNAASTTITMNDDYFIIANLEEIPTVQYQLAIDSTEGGSVTAPGIGVFTYDEGTVVNLMVEAESGYQFVEWTGDVGTIADVSTTATNITMNGSYNITANFGTLYGDYSDLLDYAIVSYDTIDIQPGTTVNGDIWLPDEDNLEIHAPLDITGEVKDLDDVELIWPTAEQLSAYYYEDVEGTYDPGPSIDIEYTKIIGPCYRDGDLVIDNTGAPDILVLEGTIYVASDLTFQQSGSHNYTVDLNGHTIFTEGGIYFPSNVVAVAGPGCIIAVGDINFQPSIVRDDFVLVMSITGQTYFHPSGDFTGCVAGNTHVQVQPACTINWISPEGKGLGFPGLS